MTDENESQSSPNLKSIDSRKTAGQYLHELLAKKNLTPIYETVQFRDKNNRMIFASTLTIDSEDMSLKTTAHDLSKKFAKQSAALSMLNTIASKENFLPDHTLSKSNDIAKDPVSSLQEQCMRRKWTLPEYEIITLEEDEQRPSVETQFKVTCSVGKYREIGYGVNKRSAKRSAAEKILNQLESSSDDGILNSLFGESKVDESYRDKLNTFYKTLRESQKPKLCKLLDVFLKDKTLDAINLLEEICEEQNFNIVYLLVEEKTEKGLFQCLIKVSSLPVAVCHGFGKDAIEAQADAARNALEYLKIFTRRLK